MSKNGNKIEMQNNSLQVLVLDKIVSFKTSAGSSKEMSFSDISEAVFGSYKFKSFKFPENKSNNCFFVLAETNSKSLIFIGIPAAESEEGAVNVPLKFEMYVLDTSSKVLDFLSFNNLKNDKGVKGRSEVHDFLRRNFVDCLDLMDRFADYDKINLPQYMGILGFFMKPTFVKCAY